jgi:hypothetical protein
VPDIPEERRSLRLDEALHVLRAGELSPLGLMPDASNSTFLAEVCHGDVKLLAIYKPRAGETPLWDFPDGTLCQREVAAYVMSTALGWPAIPPTVLREGPYGPGSAQLFVDRDQGEHYFTLREERLPDFAAVAAFDVVANNADRKAGHCLVDDDGDLWFVDHGVCFHTEPKLRTVIWEFAGEPLSSSLGLDLRRAASDLRSGQLRATLTGLLAEAEVDATAARAERLVRAGRYPMPMTRRPYPWPPV